MAEEIPVVISEPIPQYSFIRDDGVQVDHRSVVALRREFWKVTGAQLEVLSAIPDGTIEKYSRPTNRPVVWVVHGWWGNAEQNLPFLELLAARYGFMARAVSLAGHGRSRVQPRNWLETKKFRQVGAYVQNLVDLLNDSVIEPKVLVLHSGAAHWGQKAFQILKDPQAINAVRSVCYLAPVPERGTLISTGRFIRMAIRRARSGDLEALRRYCVGHFLLGRQDGHLRYLINSVVTARHILFDAATSDAFVHASLSRLDRVFLWDYVNTFLFRAVAPLQTQHGVAAGKRYLIRLGNDANYSETEHRKTAQSWGATFQLIPGVPHQGLALAIGREKVAQLLDALL